MRLVASSGQQSGKGALIEASREAKHTKKSHRNNQINLQEIIIEQNIMAMSAKGSPVYCHIAICWLPSTKNGCWGMMEQNLVAKTVGYRML
jgi:hypothetical protein